MGISSSMAPRFRGVSGEVGPSSTCRLQKPVSERAERQEGQNRMPQSCILGEELGRFVGGGGGKGGPGKKLRNTDTLGRSGKTEPQNAVESFTVDTGPKQVILF